MSNKEKPRGEWKLYKDPLIPDGTMLIGYSGRQFDVRDGMDRTYGPIIVSRIGSDGKAVIEQHTG